MKKQTLSGRFPDRLYVARTRKGWSQSDLAREIWGTVEDARGYTVARNRDRISAYERGKATPERANLDALAQALGLPPEELAPDLLMDKDDAAGRPPSLRLTVLGDGTDAVRLQVDMVTDLATASKVVALLSE